MVLENSKISIKEAQKILALNYDIKGSIEKLDGEIDFNFKVQSLKGKHYLLKLSFVTHDFLPLVVNIFLANSISQFLFK